MDLLKILIDPLNEKLTCFLCFKQNVETLSVDQKLFVCNEYQKTDTTLTGIMEYLFPTNDILFGQACINCSTFLLKAFTMLQKHNIIKDFITKITTTLNNEIDHAKYLVSSIKAVYLNLKMPLFDQTFKEFNENYSTDNNFELKPKLSDNFISSAYEYCKKCEMKFISKELLNKHEKITHKCSNNSAICEFCGKDCKKPASLKVHLNCHKEKSCPYCAKTLKSHSHFKIHVKNHEGNVRKTSRKSEYFCDMCSFKSLNKNSLEAHINKIHLQIRPFICQICDKGFYKKSNLTEHLRIHVKSKTLTCEQCGDNFVTKKTLTEHLRLHSGEKPFQCTICSQTFVTSGRRSDHFKRKHMEKTICCFVCDKKFSLRKELNMHLKKIHGQNRNRGELLMEPTNLLNQSFLDRDVLVKL